MVIDVISAFKPYWPKITGELKISWLLLYPEGYTCYGQGPVNMGTENLSSLNKYLKNLVSFPVNHKKNYRYSYCLKNIFGPDYHIYGYPKEISSQIKLWIFILLPLSNTPSLFLKKTARLSNQLYFKAKTTYFPHWIKSAESSKKHKEKFIQLSHQIKTPLLSLENQLMYSASLLPDKQQKIFEMESQKLKSLREHISHQLQLYTCFQNQDSWSNIQAPELINELYLYFYPTANKNKVKLHFLEGNPAKKNTGPGFEGNKRWIFEALQVLLENALDFCGQGGWVSLALKENTSHIRFLVSDSGKGVPEYFSPMLFKPYTSLREGGSGIGLNLALEIATQHAGGLEYFPPQNNKAHFFQLSIPKKRHVSHFPNSLRNAYAK